MCNPGTRTNTSHHVDVPVRAVRFAVVARSASAKMPEGETERPFIGIWDQAGKALVWMEVSYAQYINWRYVLLEGTLSRYFRDIWQQFDSK